MLVKVVPNTNTWDKHVNNYTIDTVQYDIKVVPYTSGKFWSARLIFYLTLQGDNSLKSVERFDHMMFVCRIQASRWSKPQREKLLCG
jgi:hypothetical protein